MILILLEELLKMPGTDVKIFLNRIAIVFEENAETHFKVKIGRTSIE